MTKISLCTLSSLARVSLVPAPLRASYALMLKRLWRFLPSPVKVEVPQLGLMLLDPWNFIDGRLFFFHVWEPTITRFIRDRIKPGAVVVDVGANIGYYTLLMR